MSIKNECKAIWAEKLADSDLSDNAKVKLPQYVDPKQFIDEEGKLDTDAFSEAVEAEIKYWSEEVGATNKILGVGMSRRTVAEEKETKEKEEEEDDKWVENMTKLSGQVQPEQTT